MCHHPQRAYYAPRSKLPKEEREHASRADCPPDGRGSSPAPGKGRAPAQRLLSTGGPPSRQPNRGRKAAWHLEGRASCPREGTRLARGSAVESGLRTVGGHGEVGRRVALWRLLQRRPLLVVGRLHGAAGGQGGTRRVLH